MTALALAQRLPEPSELERVCRAIAALDCIMVPEPYLRYFGYQPTWAAGQRLATMDNGSGDQYQIVFQDDAVVVRAFDHEHEYSPWGKPEGELADGLLDGLPNALRPIIDEPAFRIEGGPTVDLTFCAWWTPAASSWVAGTTALDGGASEMLEVVLDPTPAGYCKHAASYLSEELDPEAVAAFYDLRPTHAFALRALNPTVEVTAALSELEAMGYPVA